MNLRIRFAVLALLGAFAVALGAAPASAATVSGEEPPPFCDVTTQSSGWSGGYMVNVAIENTSSVTVTWEAKLILTGGNTVVLYWNSKFTRSGSEFTITPLAHNRTLAPGGTADFGYSGSGSPPLPTVTCKPIR